MPRRKNKNYKRKKPTKKIIRKKIKKRKTNKIKYEDIQTVVKAYTKNDKYIYPEIKNLIEYYLTWFSHNETYGSMVCKLLKRKICNGKCGEFSNPYKDKCRNKQAITRYESCEEYWTTVLYIFPEDQIGKEISFRICPYCHDFFFSKLHNFRSCHCGNLRNEYADYY